MLVLSIKWYYDLLHFAVYDWLVLRMISFGKMVYLTGPSIFLTLISMICYYWSVNGPLIFLAFL